MARFAWRFAEQVFSIFFIYLWSSLQKLKKGEKGPITIIIRFRNCVIVNYSTNLEATQITYSFQSVITDHLVKCLDIQSQTMSDDP